jgi:hypothetical protein
MIKAPINNAFLLGLVIVLSEAAVFSQSWRGIVPLRTSRKEVEKLLGPPTVVGTVPTYYFDDGRVEVFYSRPCGGPPIPNKWNVPRDTAFAVSFVPKNEARLADMRLDLTKFRMEQGSFDNPDRALLINDEAGLTYSYSLATGFVDRYTFGPTTKDKPLRCSGYSEEEERRMRNCYPATLIVECSSEKIAIGNPVVCKAKSGAPRMARTTFKWNGSSGSSVSSQTPDTVKVVLTDSRKPKIEVTVRMVSPNVCPNTTSVELRVVKEKKRFRQRH